MGKSFEESINWEVAERDAESLVIVPMQIDWFESEQEAKDFVNECLVGYYTDKGVENWWQRARHALDDRTPAEAWEATPEKVVGLAAWLAIPRPEN